jgi:sugar lactone lactonase YvrE
MKKFLPLLLIVISSVSEKSQAQIITTVAGNGAGAETYTCCYSGDGGQAIVAELDEPIGVTFDTKGNMYIADSDNNRIRMVSTSGVISTYAGTGIQGYSGDGGLAINSELSQPQGVAFDAVGNLYIGDYGNIRIRKVNTAGIITTIAGNGMEGYSGDGGPSTAAELSVPSGVACDTDGNLYIADEAANVIRKINTAGIISTIAGNGTAAYSGDGGVATVAELSGPISITTDGTGNLYIADAGNNVIRKIDPSGIITTVAGNGFDAGSGYGGYSGDGGQATAAELNFPTGVTIDAVGNIFISDYFNARIRKVNTLGIITTIVGNGSFGYGGDGGGATNAELNYPWGITFSTTGNLYLADAGNNRIRKVTNAGQMGIEQFAVNKEQLTIYPNPATNSLQVSFAGNSEGSTLVMTDVLGNTIKEFKIENAGAPSESFKIDAGGVEAGVYFITLTSGATATTRKVVISK